MDAIFLAHVEALRPKLDALLAMPPVKPSLLPKDMPKAGVYLLSEGGEYLYVGRSNDIRGRIGRHSLPGATHRMAAFAFRLARHATGRRSAQLRGCHPAFGLLLDAAALSAPSARSFKQGWCASSANHRRSLPRVMRWVAQQNKEGGRRPGDICGVIQCVALGPHTSENRTYAFRNDLSR